MKIIVTGGAGFIGSHLCERLIDLNNTVICIDDFNDYYSPKIKEKNIEKIRNNQNFRLYRIDITESKKLEKVFEKENPELIIHLAARAGVRPSILDPMLYEKVNVLGTINLLELSRKNKIKKFIFGSSSSVYGNSKKIPFSEEQITAQISPYAVSKKTAEEYCRLYSNLYGINIISLRFFTVYGPRGRPDMAVHKFTDKISKEDVIEIYGSDKTKRDYTYVSDIIEGIIKSIKIIDNTKFENINLGDSNPIELQYLIRIIEQNLKKTAEINIIKKQEGDVDMTFADISKAKKLLDYEPKIPIEEGIKKFIDWYKKNVV